MTIALRRAIWRSLNNICKSQPRSDIFPLTTSYLKNHPLSNIPSHPFIAFTPTTPPNPRTFISNKSLPRRAILEASTQNPPKHPPNPLPQSRQIIPQSRARSPKPHRPETTSAPAPAEELANASPATAPPVPSNGPTGSASV